MISLGNFKTNNHEFHASWDSLKLKYIEFDRVKFQQAFFCGFIIVLNIVVMSGWVVLVPHLEHLINPSNDPFVYWISLYLSLCIPSIIDWIKPRPVCWIPCAYFLVRDHIFQMLDDPLDLRFPVNLRKLILLNTLPHQETSLPYLFYPLV